MFCLLFFLLLLFYFSQSYLPSPDSFDFFLLGLLFFNCPNSRRIQIQYQIPDWLDLCWIMQTVLELRSGIPRHSAMHPAFWLPSRRAPSELVTKQKPDGIWEECCTRLGGWVSDLWSYFCYWINNRQIIKQPLALQSPPSVNWSLRVDNRAQPDTLQDRLPNVLLLQLTGMEGSSEKNKPNNICILNKRLSVFVTFMLWCVWAAVWNWKEWGNMSPMAPLVKCLMPLRHFKRQQSEDNEWLEAHLGDIFRSN